MKRLTKKTRWTVRFIIREIALVSVYVCAMFFALGAAFVAYLYFTSMPAKDLATRKIPQTTVIYDRSGRHALYEIFGEENRKILPHDEIPDAVRLTTLSAEDDDFYNHHGIDFKSIARAVKVDIKNRDLSQGGSTITQQLARNALLTRAKTFRRKILETILALKIERKYSKADILDMYLNQVPYGSNAYGIESAAETFFHKKASDLTLDEAALLAALPKATTFYSPYGEHADALVSRQQKIIARLETLNLADHQTVTDAQKIDTLKKIKPLTRPIEAPHFVFYVISELEKKYGREAIEEGGLKVLTTLDYEKQKLGEKILAEKSKYNQSRYGASNSALVSIDPRDGAILAMVGSNDYFDASIDGEVNVATRPRQPGSSFKPFAYAKAFEKGYQPETLILDAQTNFGPDGSGRNYIPRNYDGKFHGVVTMRQALAMSLNVPAVKTLQMVGVNDTVELAQRLGITTLNDKNRYGLSLVIGGGEVTLLDETAGYSVFANDGKRNPVTAIMEITNPSGKVLEAIQPKNIPVLDSQVARKINSILSDNQSRIKIFGPNNLLHIDGRTVAAKTGTSQDWKDGWTVGYTPTIATGVWVGNNDGRLMKPKSDGSYVAAPIWHAFMKEAIAGTADQSFIAYVGAPTKKTLVRAISEKITYYRKGSGKQISAEKARKADPGKVRIKIEKIYSDKPIEEVSPLVIE